MTAAAVDALVDGGPRAGRASWPAAGLVCLGEVGIGNTTVAAALAVRAARARARGRGGARLRRRRRDARPQADRRRPARSPGRGSEHGAALAEPLTALAALGGPELALLAGVTLGAAAGGRAGRAGRARHVARRAGRRPPGAGGAGRARRRATAAASGRTPPCSPSSGLEPLLDLRLRAGEGVGACLAAQLLLTALGRAPDGGADLVRLRRPRRVLVLGGARSGQVAVRRGAAAPAARTSTTSPAVCSPTAATPSGTTGWPLHRARRPASWRTLETVDLPAVLRSPGPPVLLDCLSTWLARAMDDCGDLDRRPGRRRPAGRGGRRRRRGVGGRRPAGDRGEQRGRQRRRAGHAVRTAVPRRARRAQRADRRARPTGSGC